MSKTTNKFSAEARDRVVRLVLDRSHRGAIGSSPMAKADLRRGADRPIHLR